MWRWLLATRISRSQTACIHFASPIPYNTRYTVTLVSPASQDCHFLPAGNAVGTVGMGNVTNVNVTCVPHTYTLGRRCDGLGFDGQRRADVGQ